jgi:hypothetical protein
MIGPGAHRPARGGVRVCAGSQGGPADLAEAIRYALSRWAGLTCFVDAGRIEIDINVVERAIRPLALTRKNALFAGSDRGGEHWAIIASLVETCKLCGVDPHRSCRGRSPYGHFTTPQSKFRGPRRMRTEAQPCLELRLRRGSHP